MQGRIKMDMEEVYLRQIAEHLKKQNDLTLYIRHSIEQKYATQIF